MVNDGFNLLTRGWPETGVHALAPGEHIEATWVLSVERL